MEQIQNNKRYDLEERTFKFVKEVAEFCKLLPKTFYNVEYSKQLIRSSSSVGANYIEANEALGKKDFEMRIRICRKEAKESSYWLRLLIGTNSQEIAEKGRILDSEAIELKKIFSSIIGKK